MSQPHTRIYTPEERHAIRRAVLRSGPGAVARMLGNPTIAAQVARQLRADTPAPARQSAAPLPPERALLVDVFDEQDEVLVVADLPIAEDSTLQVRVEHNILHIDHTNGQATYRCKLPAQVDTSTLQQKFHDGILEMRLRKSAA
ncbi:MAG: hypothetical protein HC876_05560 [Chloroflexaceae bacterium]|nr:hypothetical protein [Chloroflexaceae bacterium]